MQQHAVPRQITTFEFKLIGFMTLKQFIYLVIFGGCGYIVYALFPIPFVDILLGILVGVIGVAMAFVEIQDRPIDVWIRNFIRRLNSPTQYTYKKENPPVYFFENLYFLTDPHAMVAHVETQEKLTAYLNKRRGGGNAQDPRKKQVQQLLNQPSGRLTAKTKDGSVSQPASAQRKAFLVGTVKNSKNTPLPEMLIYISDQAGKAVRLLKTNSYGIFATYHTLPKGTYALKPKDPNNSYFFDTIQLSIDGPHTQPLEIVSKEMV